MEQAASRTATINLTHFPPYQMVAAGKPNLVSDLSRYLKNVISDQLRAPVNSVEFPSFITLAAFFHCSYLEMYDAFRMLRAEGYDYQFSSLDGTIQVWRNTKLVTMKEKI